MVNHPFPIQQTIEELIARSGPVEVGLAACDLQTGADIFVRADETFHAASTYKLSIMMEAFRRAHSGGISLEDTVLLKNEFHSIVDESLYSLSIEDDSEKNLYLHLGEKRSVRELIRPMITHSSNLATNLLVELLEPEKITVFMHSLGAEGLLILRGVEDGKAFALGLNNTVTARGLMQVLRRLAERQVVSPEASDEMIAILQEQAFNEGIPAGLPGDVVVAHKTGSITKVYHDAAIVYPPRRKPYILVVLTRGLPEAKEAPELVSSSSRHVYEYFDSL
jgi:beta-lactamase class A